MERNFDITVFAYRLKDLRSSKNIGQNELASILQISNASVSYWENAKQEPSASALFKLAQFFDVTTDYLLGLED